MRGRVPPLPRGAVVAACLLAAALVAAGGVLPAPPRPGAAGAAVAPALQSPTWSNGAVVLAFPNDRPTFTLTASSNQSVTANQSLTGLAEINRTGAIVSFAAFGAAATQWAFSAVSGPSNTSITARATVVAMASVGEWESGDYAGVGGEVQALPSDVGFANVTLNFQLNASTGRDPTAVSYGLSVAGWPWLRSNDTLGIEVRSNATVTPGHWILNGSYGLTELAPVGAQPLANFDWAANATAEYSGGLRSDTSVGAYHNISTSGGNFLLRLQFGAVTGGYSSLSYDPTLTLLLPPARALVSALPAWLLTTTALEVLAGAAAASVVLAAVAGRRRRPPDDGL